MDFKFIIKRATNIIVKPVDEWQVIKNEASDKKQVIMNYALPVIAVVAIASLIGGFIFPRFYQISVSYQILSAVIAFIVPFAGLYISAIVINELAPSFGSKKDINAAFKLVIYSFTASFLASIVTGLIPPLFFIGIFGLYSIYLLWIGITPMMETPENKKVGYVIVSALIIIVVNILIGLILGFILLSFFVAPAVSGIS